MDYNILKKALIAQTFKDYCNKNRRSCFLCSRGVGSLYLILIEGDYHVILRCNDCKESCTNPIIKLSDQDIFTLKLIKEV